MEHPPAASLPEYTPPAPRLLAVQTARAATSPCLRGKIGAGLRITRRALQRFRPTWAGIIQAGKQLILVVLVLACCFMLLKSLWPWMFGDDMITIAPFIDLRTEGPGEKSKGWGPELTHLLVSEINRIHQLHTLRNPWGSAEETPALEMQSAQVSEAVGTVSFAGLEIPVGEMILLFKSIVPRLHAHYVVTGSLQSLSRWPSQGQLLVRLDENNQPRKYWTYELNVTNHADIYRNIQTLGYEIMWNTSQKIETHSLQNFRDFIEGVSSFRAYKDKRSDADFRAAEKSLLKALKSDPYYARASFYLGNLYNWKATGTEIASNEEKDWKNQAIAAYNHAAFGHTVDSHEAVSLSMYGLGLVHYRQAMKMRKNMHHINDKDSDDISKLILDELKYAKEYFTAVLKNDKNFYFAQTGVGMTYEKMALLEGGGLNFKANRSQIEENIMKAIEEFKRAKSAAKKQKHTQSMKWIDKKINKLELFNQHHRQSGFLDRHTFQVWEGSHSGSVTHSEVTH